MDDNYVWPSVSPNDLLATDLPAREHLLQYFNENPSRSKPPSNKLWEEKGDRGKSYRDLRDGVFKERRKHTFINSWGVDINDNRIPLIFLDITRHSLDVEAVYVVAEALQDNVLAQLEELHLGRSEVWDQLYKDDIQDPSDSLLSAQTLAGALILHNKLRLLRLAAVDIPISILRGLENDEVLDLAHRGLRPIHGVIISAGIRNNQVLISIDLRLNTETLGKVGLASLTQAFSTGGVMKLKTLNGITIDGVASLTIHKSEEYELVWIARRLGASCNHHELKSLILDSADINEHTSYIVGDMIAKMNQNIKLIDLSHNQSICGIRCDRYGIWRGECCTIGLVRILEALSSATTHVESLKFNGCSLGVLGIEKIAFYLSNGKLKLRNLELCHCNLSFDDLSKVFSALGVTRLPGSDTASARSVTAMVSQAEPSAAPSSLSLWSRTDLGSSDVEEFQPYCLVESLDTRGNPIDRASQAELSLLIEDIYDVGVLMCLNGIDFRPYKHLLAGPTSDHDGHEWWLEHRYAFDNTNENVKLVEASGRLLEALPIESPAKNSAASSSQTLVIADQNDKPQGRRPRTTRGGFLDNEHSVHHYDAPPLDIGSGWFADMSSVDGEGRSLHTSDWRQDKSVNGGGGNSETPPKGLAVHELCFAAKMSLRMRITHLVLKGTRICGLTAKGEGKLGLSEKEKVIALEPLRAVSSLMRDSAYLLSLDLGDNGLGEVEGAIELLATALSDTVSMRSLNLRNNRLNPFHLEFISGALELNVSLETINLGENLLGGYNAIRTTPKPKPPQQSSKKKEAGGVRFGSTNQSSGVNQKTNRPSKFRGVNNRLKTKSMVSYTQTVTSSLTNGTKLAESLTSMNRPVSAIVSRFISTIVEKNNALMKVDVRGNGWTDDEKELFADALDIPRYPPLKEFRIS